MERPSRRDFLRGSTLALGGLGAGLLAANNVSTDTRQTGQEVRGLFDGELDVRDSDYPKAIEQVKRSVFKVEGPRSHGSGFLLAPGYVLTNFHVTEGNTFGVETERGPLLPFPSPLPLPPIKEINDPNFELSCFTDDDRSPGRKFRASPAHLANGRRALYKDMALLQLPPDAQVCGEPVQIGKVQAGAPVMVMGNPHDLTGHTTFGRVSKAVVFDNSTEKWKGVPFFATDAGINGGNSGGPAFGLRKERDPSGKVQLRTELIGMSTWSYRLPGMAGAIRADYIAFIATTKWGLPLMTPAQVEAFRKEFPMAGEEPPTKMPMSAQ